MTELSNVDLPLRFCAKNNAQNRLQSSKIRYKDLKGSDKDLEGLERTLKDLSWSWAYLHLCDVAAPLGPIRREEKQNKQYKKDKD